MTLGRKIRGAVRTQKGERRILYTGLAHRTGRVRDRRTSCRVVTSKVAGVNSGQQPNCGAIVCQSRRASRKNDPTLVLGLALEGLVVPTGVRLKRDILLGEQYKRLGTS